MSLKAKSKPNRFQQGRVTLERALSKLGIASRTKANLWIKQGLVSVNGEVKNNPLFLVSPEKAKIEISGAKVEKRKTVLILLHKPKKVVTTNSDEKGRATVFSLLPNVQENLHAVGRLDMATTGLLLLTNNTKISSWLTDPKNKIPRIYIVTVQGLFTTDKCALLEKGIMAEEGDLLKATSVRINKESLKETHLTVELCEGKNREIRRMFETLGHAVTKLKRIQFGGFTLGNLEPGQYRTVSQTELKKLFPNLTDASE